jgi:hypothetical protein
MPTLLRRYALLILAVSLVAAGPAPTPPGQTAGRFVSVTGDVGVVGADGVRRGADRGGDIREGDTIVTGPDALAQARMSDGALISVRGDSEFKLERFSYKGREDRSASFVVNILKGGFRTITGLIAQVNRGGYRISTPAATIGVRGTHFEVVHVLPQIASPDAPAGTYNRVFEGITTVQNPAGAVLQVVRDQTAFAALQGGTPALVAPPALIFGRPTPVPRAAAPQGDAHKSAAIKGEDRAHKMGDRGLKLDARALKRGDTPAVVGGRPILREPLPTTPLETTAIPTAPLLTPIDPVTTIQIAPTSTTTSPTTTIVAPTILQAPTTTTIKLDSTTPVLTSPTLSTSPTTTTTTTSPLTSPTLSSPTLIRR